MEFDGRIKTTASYQSQGINLENCVRLFRYSYWLLRNFTVNFDDQNFPIRFTTKAIAGDQFYKTKIPYIVFLLNVLEIFGPNFKAMR